MPEILFESERIDLENINVSYGGDLVLSKLNYTFRKENAYTIIGPSGCGKTTLLYTLAGLVTPTGGNMHIFGKTPEKMRPHIAMVLQEYGLFPWKSVWQNIILGLQLRGKITKNEEEHAKEISHALGLTNQLLKYPQQLSGGQKQRVALARSWLMVPDLMLMDEPFSALDTITRENLQNTILTLNKERKTTWITVTHNIEEAVFLGSEILLISSKGGNIKRIFHNSNFGDLKLRENPEFYALCLEIRHAMQEDQDET